VQNNQLLWTGIVGTIVSALCCFTPMLVILLTVLGLSAAAIYLDMVAIPALAFFSLLTLFALWRGRRA
jgi:mercuric ion transport protein